jgi:hypothetical protein
MKLQKPRGYPTATLPEALELPRHIPHWSWDGRAAGRMRRAEHAVRSAVLRLAKRLLLESL